MASILRAIHAGATIVVAAGALFVGYRLIRTQVAADVYRERLEGLAKDYESLRGTYNEAVARSAVTELIVEKGALRVRVRNAGGVVAEIPTPFDPLGEIYVDYVVLDNRLWIRRVFDARTPPEQGLVIDPKLARVAWEDDGAQSGATHGKAVYRALGEGRWVISVSGDGALGLARARGPVNLAAAPTIREHGTVAADTRARVHQLGAGDVWRWLTGS